MPGWVNVNLRTETYQKLQCLKGEKSFDEYIDGLLDPKDCSVCAWRDKCAIVNKFRNSNQPRHCSEYAGRTNGT